MYFDTHAHLTGELFWEAEDLISKAKEAGVEYIVDICTDANSLREGIILAERHPEILLAGATTPHDVEKEGELLFPLFSEEAKKGSFVAIGETGLDYHYEHSPKELQKKYLEKYVDLALTLDYPLIFHCRDAFEDLFAITASSPITAVIHCFTGTLEEAEEALDRGWYISFSGIVTFKKSDALREVASMVPVESILVETDAPYLAPQSKRGKRNEPAYVKETADFLADWKKIDRELFASQTSDNAKKFYRL